MCSCASFLFNKSDSIDKFACIISEINCARLLDLSRERETLLYSVDRQYETY